MSHRSRVDVVLNASAGLAILLALAAAGWSVAAHRPPPQYATGDRFDDIPNLNPADAPSTLVLWVDSRCGPCTASMPFYRRLTAKPHRTRVIVLGRESSRVLEDYLAGFGVRPAQVISVGDRVLTFRGTPTVVLIGADRIVRAVWYGRRQTQSEEEDIIKTLD